MANEFIKYAFTAGEISPQLYGRSDLQQYDLGLQKAENWFVDYRGGLTNRAGFEFCEFLKSDDKNFKLFSFNFSPRLSNKYILLFGHNYLRFVQDGAYVLESEKTVTNIDTDGTVTSPAHGYSNGDWVVVDEVMGPTNVNGRRFQISNVTTNTFRLKELPHVIGFTRAGPYTSGGVAQRVYTLSTPYSSDDLDELSLKQQRDYVRMTHPDFRVKNLIRNGATDWTIENEILGTGVAAPTGLLGTGSAAGTTGTLFTVTAVLRDGQETVMAEPVCIRDIGSIITDANSITYNWDVHPKAVSYNVYRGAIMLRSDDVTKGLPMGFIGNVLGTQLLDSNIVPDYTKTPPINNDPFTPGQIEFIHVTAGGTGHDDTTTVSITDPDGSGFVGYVMVDSDGAVTGIGIIDAGSGYTAPTVVFGGAGTGATANADTTPLTGTYPTISEIFQQRQLYAASDKDPLTIWGSRPKQYSNFDFSKITVASDEYEFDVDAQRIAPILHLESLRGGLIVMSEDQIWQLTGGQETSVTPLNALADPQTYLGVGSVPPLRIGNDLLYVQSQGYGVYLLTYNEYAKVYSSDDKTILSGHLFGNNREIIDWASCAAPFKLVHSVRADGALLTYTFMKAGKDDSISAWTPWSTRGYFEAITSIFENGYDTPYVVVRRLVNNQWVKFLERGTNRGFTAISLSNFLDCSLSYKPNRPGGSILPSAATGTISVTASSGVFPVGCEGWVIRGGGGRVKITSRTSSTVVVGLVEQDFTDILPQDPLNRVNEIDVWSLDEPFTTVSGLWHLEGEAVTAVYDGNVARNLVVTSGSITLPYAATRCVVGFSYTSTAQTLPPVVSDAVIEGRKKRVMSAVCRLNETKGLRYGAGDNKTYPVKERTTEPWEEAIRVFSGQQPIAVAPQWEIDASLTLVQEEPLPATILGVIIHTEIGDDPD